MPSAHLHPPSQTHKHMHKPHLCYFSPTHINLPQPSLTVILHPPHKTEPQQLGFVPSAHLHPPTRTHKCVHKPHLVYFYLTCINLPWPSPTVISHPPHETRPQQLSFVPSSHLHPHSQTHKHVHKLHLVYFYLTHINLLQPSLTVISHLPYKIEPWWLSSYQIMYIL